MKKKIKILMITPYLPYPPYSGGQTRSFNLIKHLARHCEITLFSFALPDQDPGQIHYLEKFCRRVYTNKRGKTWSLKKILFTAFSPYPLLISNYFSPKLKKAIAEELRFKNYDLIHVECFYLMPNIPRKVDVPIILVDQTIEFAVYQHFVETLPGKFLPIKPALWLDVAKLKFWENYFWRKSDVLVAVSENDKRLMARLSKRKVDVVFNGVDDSFLKLKRVEKYKRPTILFGVANFKWMQNKEGVINLLKFVWPEVKRKVPEAQLVIAGRHSAQFLAKRQELLAYPESIRFGDVGNPEEVYRKSWLMVAPMGSGGGSRTKFFEAMACRLPIITTPEGIEGIDAQSGKEVLIGKGFEKLIELTVGLLKDKQMREKIGMAGRELVRRRYSWRISANKLLGIYRKVAKDE
jgi:glycosyltransferase involved in cell wall biosynthesis